MMIVGAPGAGKSGAAVLLVLAALRHRDSVPHTERAEVPVPVLFTPHDWNPKTQPVRDWLVSQLQQNYDGLFTGKRGARKAARLINEDKVMVILDGLDEMAEQLRPLPCKPSASRPSFDWLCWLAVPRQPRPRVRRSCRTQSRSSCKTSTPPPPPTTSRASNSTRPRTGGRS
jgi:hypothetical protein